MWNYFELIGMILYYWAGILDFTSPNVTPTMKILFCLSILFTLVKVVYLIRVFRQLNFLVTMFITVVKEIYYFMILFTIFCLTFAETFHILEVDIESYGRLPGIVAHLISVLRCAMGDFSMINTSQGFDLHTEIDGDLDYRHHYSLVIFTFIIFIICVFFLFMIFMNFIIAVIGESYSKVI